MAYGRESRVELVARNIEKTLGDIRRSAGWDNDLIVSRLSSVPADAVDRSCVIHQQTPRDLAATTHKRMFMVPFRVAVAIQVSDSDTTSIDTHRNSVAADVHKALMLDPHRGTDAAGNPLAVDTYVHPPQIDAPEFEGMAGIVVPVDVKLTFDESDPYTA